jgi:hypothetical protein
MGETLHTTLASPVRVCLRHGVIPHALSINVSVMISVVFDLTVSVARVLIKVTTFILLGNKNHITI